MNERIKQLANIWANRRAEDEKLGIVYTFSEPALEQFAELIVAETISVLQKRFMGDLNREDMEVRKCIEDVKTHFAVKE